MTAQLLWGFLVWVLGDTRGNVWKETNSCNSKYFLKTPTGTHAKWTLSRLTFYEDTQTHGHTVYSYTILTVILLRTCTNDYTATHTHTHAQPPEQLFVFKLSVWFLAPVNQLLGTNDHEWQRCSLCSFRPAISVSLSDLRSTWGLICQLLAFLAGVSDSHSEVTEV